METLGDSGRTFPLYFWGHCAAFLNIKLAFKFVLYGCVSSTKFAVTPGSVLEVLKLVRVIMSWLCLKSLQLDNNLIEIFQYSKIRSFSFFIYITFFLKKSYVACPWYKVWLQPPTNSQWFHSLISLCLPTPPRSRQKISSNVNHSRCFPHCCFGGRDSHWWRAL